MRTGRQLIAMRLLAGSAAILMHPDAALAQQEVSPAAQEDVSQDIVVTGVRGAQQKAINVKRDATQIVDSIAAEDIGKLPDATIADSLQRVPGVQITRSAGEGAS
ncbi:TonB-dependent receptor plug domain-containing protein [Sphingomonas aerolata]